MATEHQARVEVACLTEVVQKKAEVTVGTEMESSAHSGAQAAERAL